MLKKLTEPEIPKDTPFANDALKREPCVTMLTTLIESTQQPFVLSVEAPWGCWGKTTFVRMWQAHLKNKGHVCLHFNAWENDFVDDPLVGFIGEMNALLDPHNEETKGKIQKSLDLIKSVGMQICRTAIPFGLQVATQGLLTEDSIKQTVGTISSQAEKIGELASALAKDRLEKYEADKKGIKAFREHIKKLAQELIAEKGCNSPVVFFIDELDRCRPDFAVALLERIKHLFNVPQVVFVLSVDRAQLNQTVKSIYGLEMDPDGYLRRFIDLAYTLPQPNAEDFADAIYRRFGMEGRIHDSSIGRVIKKGFAKYSRAFELSLRTQEQCFTEINILTKTCNYRIVQKPIVYIFLITLRAYKPGILLELIKKKTTIDTVLQRISTIDDAWCRNWAEAVLIVVFLDDSEIEERIIKLKQKKVSTDTKISTRSKEITDYISQLGGEKNGAGGISSFLAEIEMTNQFR